MSILHINKNNYIQNLSTCKEKKEEYGEIFTPFRLIYYMFNMLDDEIFKNPNTKWLDAGSGTGFFSMVLYWKLIEGLSNEFENINERHNHIIKNMIYMSEIQDDNIKHLKKIFGNEANIIEGDFLNTSGSFDYVIGNPPYNSNGLKKVPTNISREKKEDGKTIWISFVRHSIELLKYNGQLLMIIPLLWMRPDKAKSYDLFTKHKLNKIYCLSNTQTNQLFSGQAQTPTSCVLLTKRENDWNVDLYDTDNEKYIEYNYIYGDAIPVFGASVINKIKPNFGEPHLNVLKTNMPPKGVSISDNYDNKHVYKNIRTVILNGLNPQLVIEYSDKPLAFYGKKKIILGHKMYGFPYIDRKGDFGISNRDNYIICNDNINILERICDFLSTKLALYIFESTRYRMKYLEKEAFTFIPDINIINNITDAIDDNSLCDFFCINEKEKNSIFNLHKKQYTFTYINLIN